MPVRGQVLAAAYAGAVRKLRTEKRVVGRSEAVLAWPECGHGDEVVRFDPALKGHVVGAPFHGPKQRSAPTSAQLDFRPLRSEPSRFDGVGEDVARAKKDLGVLNDSCVNPQPRPEGGRHVAVEKQRARPPAPVVAFLTHPNRDGRRQSPGYCSLEAIDRGDRFVEETGRTESVHRAVVRDLTRERKSKGDAPTRRGDVIRTTFRERAGGAETDGGALGPEVADDLTGLAQHRDAVERVRRRTKWRGPVPRRHGLHTRHHHACTVACASDGPCTFVEWQMPRKGSGSLGPSRMGPQEGEGHQGRFEASEIRPHDVDLAEG